MAGKNALFFHNTDIGQNFLIDKSVADFIVKRSAPNENDVVLEVGPGDGALTRGLLTTPLRALYSVEVDARLKEPLEKIAAADGRYAPLWGDAVRFDYAALPLTPTKIIANLPYHITTPVIWAFLERLTPRGAVYMLLMTQKEAAARIARNASGRERSPLGVTVEAMGSAEILREIPPTAFYPRPRVESALVEIKITKNERLANDAAWRALLSRSFASRRKTLVNNWAAGYGTAREKAFQILSKRGLKPTARAEELSLDEWLALAEEPEFFAGEKFKKGVKS